MKKQTPIESGMHISVWVRPYLGSTVYEIMIIDQEIVTMKIYLSAVNQVIFWYMSTEAPRNTSKQYRRAVDLNWTSSIDVVYGVG